MEILDITDANLPELLEGFGKFVDKKGNIVDKKSNEQVVCRYTHTPLTKKNIGGILPGSEIFIANTDSAYAGYALEASIADDETQRDS